MKDIWEDRGNGIAILDRQSRSCSTTVKTLVRCPSAGRVLRHAAMHIATLVDSQAIGVITGEVGGGKTVAARAAVSAAIPPATR